jgi:hypothetical protein
MKNAVSVIFQGKKVKKLKKDAKKREKLFEFS